MKVFQSDFKQNLVSPCMVGSKLDKFEYVQMVGADQATGGGGWFFLWTGGGGGWNFGWGEGILAHEQTDKETR